MQHTDSTVTIDGFIKLNCPPKVAVLFKELRAQVGLVRAWSWVRFATRSFLIMVVMVHLSSTASAEVGCTACEM